MSRPPRVLGLARYPVKSLHGEQVGQLDLGPRGAVRDRLWAVRTATGKLGSGKATRRFAPVPGLLELRAGELDGRVVVTLPDGGMFAVDDEDAGERLSRQLGQPVTLVRESEVSHFDDGPVSLLGQASVAAVARSSGQPVDAERFRANVLLDTTEPFLEDSWLGFRLRVGSAVLEVVAALPRCVMVDARTAELPAQHGTLAAVGRVNAARLGVVASVAQPGTVSVGDVVQLL